MPSARLPGVRPFPRGPQAGMKYAAVATIHDELQHVGAAVVPRDVELPLWAAKLLAPYLRDDDRLLVVRGPRDHPAVGIHDRAVAGVEPLGHGIQVLRLEGETVGHVGLPHRDRAADHVAAAFLRDVPERREPRLAP